MSETASTGAKQHVQILPLLISLFSRPSANYLVATRLVAPVGVYSQIAFLGQRGLQPDHNRGRHLPGGSRNAWIKFPQIRHTTAFRMQL